MTYLVLSRNIDQAITIGDDIRVVVLGVKGSQVRFGIEAPRNIAVDREEIAIKKAKDAMGEIKAR